MSEMRSDHQMDGPGRRWVGDTLSRWLWPLEAGSLCAAARGHTGLEDFGVPSVDPALSVLVKSLEREADLRPLGRYLMRGHLRELLETRLQLVAEWHRQEEPLAALRIERPVFITGMPRSGSTFLHELLAQDPGNRVPRVWEVMFPVPPPDGKRWRSAPRVRKAALRLWWFRRLAPRADAVHPLRAETPQECVVMHSYTLLSEEFVTTCHVPRYEAFLHAANLLPAYAWQKRLLQYLQSSRPTQRWVLKSPDHVYGLEALFRVFPDAVIVQTHRNPVDVLKSSIRLVEVLQDLFGRPRDPRQRALHEAASLGDATDRFICFREAHPELAGRFIDVRYDELVAKPLATVREIYQRLGILLTDQAVASMGRLVSHRSRYPKPRVVPTLADLGIDVRAQARPFHRYCSRFGIPWRQAEVS